VDDEELEIRLIRAQEISRYVEHGYLIAGLRASTDPGKQFRCARVGEFVFSSDASAARWVLAVPEDSPDSISPRFEGKRIATEVVQLTADILNSTE
jgi:ATP phosphoribosyltransferase